MLVLNQSVSGGGGLVEGARLVGTKLSTKANSLLLKKYIDGSVSAIRENWIRFPNAAPQGNFETFGAKEQEQSLGVAFDYLRSACEALIEEVTRWILQHLVTFHFKQ